MASVPHLFVADLGPRTQENDYRVSYAHTACGEAVPTATTTTVTTRVRCAACLAQVHVAEG